MAVDESNQAQADFWTAAGPLWTEMRDRFDAQANEHGLAAIDALMLSPGESVIDIGCGGGTTTLQLAERVGPSGRVVGLDISPTMIDGATALAASHGVETATFEVSDAMVETFDADADAVYSRFGVMFFSDAAEAFGNILTALRPGGRLGFVCWQSPHENLWASLPIAVAARHVEIPFGDDPTAPGPFSLGDAARLRSILEAAGYVDIAIERRVALVRMGADMDDAIDFMSKLMPAVAELESTDPDKSAALRADMAAELAQWDGPNGVETRSAVWIVTARRPTQ